MPIETVYPHETTSIDEPPNVANAYGAPDGSYAGDGNYFDDVVWRVKFDRPLTGPPANGTHQVTIYLRKNASGGNDPTLSVSASSSRTATTVGVYSGTAITDGVTSVTFSITESQVSTLYPWDSLTLTMLRGGGGPNSRRQIEVDAIEIDFETVTAETGEWVNTFDGGPEGTDITVANSGTYGHALSNVGGSGTASAWEYRAAGAYSGTRGLRHTPQGNTTSLRMEPTAKQPKAAFRFFYRSSDNAGAYTTTASISQRLWSAAPDYCSISIIPGVEWTAGPANNRTTMNGVPLANTWYCVDMFWDGATTTYKARLTEASSGTILDTLTTTIPAGVGVDYFQVSAPFDGGFTADLDEWQVDWDATDLYPALTVGPATHQTTGALAGTAGLTAEANVQVTHTADAALAATADLTAATPIYRFNGFDGNAAAGVTISGSNSDNGAGNDAFTLVAGTSTYDDTLTHTGTLSAKSDTGTAGTYNVFGWRELGHGYTRAALSCWVNWPGPATTGTGASEYILLNVRDSSDVLVSLLRWDTDTGQVRIRDGAGGYTTITTLSPPAGWYRLDFFADWGTPALKGRVVDETGGLVAEAIDAAPDFTGYSAEAWDLRVGHQDSNPDGTVVHFDDFSVAYGATDYLEGLSDGRSVALSGSAGLTAGAQVVRSTTGALAGSAGITLSETLLLPVTGDLGATAGLTATASTTTPPVTFTGALAGSAGLTAEAGVVKSTQVSMAATGLLGASGALTLQGQATLAATGALTAGSASLVTLDGSLAATGTLQGVASREVALQGPLAASAGFSAQAGVVKSTQASMASVASLDASGVKTLVGQADLAATGTLAAAGAGASTITLDGSLAGSAGLTGEAQVVRSGAVALGAAANLTGAPSVTMATSGALAALAGLSAQSGGAKTTTVVQAFSGALSASGLILKPSTGGSTATADLVADAQVIRAGEATLAATSLMDLQAKRTMEASADLLATGSTVVLVTAAPPITLRPLGLLPGGRSLSITPRPMPGTASHSSATTPRPTP